MTSLKTAFFKTTFLLVILCAGANVFAAELAAHVTELKGKAYAKPPEGAIRPLSVNDKLFAEERIITSRKSSLEFTYTDKTVITLGASTIVNIDDYQYKKDEDDDAEGATTSILQG
ncbi:MAG: hypothetical protein ACU84Q_05220, partial [Gammaproteobacteria bacterium]